MAGKAKSLFGPQFQGGGGETAQIALEGTKFLLVMMTAQGRYLAEVRGGGGNVPTKRVPNSRNGKPWEGGQKNFKRQGTASGGAGFWWDSGEKGRWEVIRETETAAVRKGTKGEMAGW